MIVRLKEFENEDVSIGYSSFNSMIVRLKVRQNLRRISIVTSFNSMIVRLKVVAFYTSKDWYVFQFYDSPIKSRSRNDQGAGYD